MTPETPDRPASLWAPENLTPFWVPLGIRPAEQSRTPAERAQMLARLGFTKLAYIWPGIEPFAFSWNDAPIPPLGDELAALADHGIELRACWFPFEPEDPVAAELLEAFARHGVRPQLWTMQSGKDDPQTPEEWEEVFAGARSLVRPGGPTADSPEVRQAIEEALSRRVYEPSFAHTPEEHQATLERESDRIAALARLAAPYGCTVHLYNHHGWFGLMENQVAMIERLASLGIDDVGIVYTFSHSRDGFHDDSTAFPQLWETIRPHVVAVNIGGTRCDGMLTYPSQDDRELSMMRTIQESGWRGPVVMKAMHAEDTGDTAITLENLLLGVDWCAAELAQPGSGGPRPFEQVDQPPRSDP
jgi:sugar phosphate isomerase/epimerase